MKIKLDKKKILPLILLLAGIAIMVAVFFYQSCQYEKQLEAAYGYLDTAEANIESLSAANASLTDQLTAMQTELTAANAALASAQESLTENGDAQARLEQTEAMLLEILAALQGEPAAE